VTHSDLEPGAVGYTLKGLLPQAIPRGVAAAAVSGNEKMTRVRVRLAAHRAPPLADGGTRELRRVVIDPDAHPALVPTNVVDAFRVLSMISRK
jgi:hypothetical protein